MPARLHGGLSWPRAGACLLSSVWTSRSGGLSQVAILGHAAKADGEVLTLAGGPLWELVHETLSYLLRMTPSTLPSPPCPSHVP